MDEPERRAARRCAARPRRRARAACARASRADSSSSRIWSRSSACAPFALVARVQREPEHADRVRLPRPEQRRRHREVLVDAREGHRLREGLGARSARVGSSGGSPSAIRFALPASMLRSSSSSSPASARRPERDEERRRLLAVRVVGGVDDLLGRDVAVEVEQVDRAPDRGVEEDARAAGEVLRPACARSAIPAWAMISCASGVARRRAARARRRSAAARGRRGSGSARGARRRARRPASSRSSFSRNRCARGCSLIPRAPRSRQRSPPRSGPRRGRAGRTGSAGRPSARRSASVRSFAARKAGCAVGLVEAEHEAARDAVAVDASGSSSS